MTEEGHVCLWPDETFWALILCLLLPNAFKQAFALVWLVLNAQCPCSFKGRDKPDHEALAAAGVKQGQFLNTSTCAQSKASRGLYLKMHIIKDMMLRVGTRVHYLYLLHIWPSAVYRQHTANEVKAVVINALFLMLLSLMQAQRSSLGSQKSIELP